MRWGEPCLLPVTLIVVAALVIGLALDATRRRRLLERIGDAAQLGRMAASLSPWRRTLKAALRVAGIALCGLALARPQVEGRSTWRQRGIDLAVVVDLSKSMLARDVYPSRLERARLEAEALIDAFGGGRVAVVAFAGASIHYPLTTDHEAAKILLRGIGPADLPPGSDLGGAILTARCLLRPDVEDLECARRGGGGQGGDPLDERERQLWRERRPEPSVPVDRARAIVLLSDGEQTVGEAGAQAERAAQLGIQLFALGIGRVEGERIPELDPDGEPAGWKVGPDGRPLLTRLDEAALKALARTGGGEEHYVREDPSRIGAEALTRQLARLKEGDLEERVVRSYREAYAWLLLPGFLLLVIEACLSDRRRLASRARRRADEARPGRAEGRA